MSNESGNAWAPPKGPFTRQGSTLLRGDGHKLAIAMAANEADWMLKLLNAAALAAMPGWKLVPIEPTKAMLRVGAESFDHPSVYMGGPSENGKRYSTRIYAAMLSASPAPEEK